MNGRATPGGAQKQHGQNNGTIIVENSSRRGSGT
jgi:hypothetical protein